MVLFDPAEDTPLDVLARAADETPTCEICDRDAPFTGPFSVNGRTYSGTPLCAVHVIQTAGYWLEDADE